MSAADAVALAVAVVVAGLMLAALLFPERF